MNRAFILGCSHAEGAEIDYGTEKSYPVLLANKLNFHPINLSIGGGSNDAMFRIFHELLDFEKISSSDIVIACWTGSERTETVHNNIWTPIVSGVQHSPIQEYVKQWCVYNSDRWHWRLNKIKNIISMNEIARRVGIKIINIHSFNYIEGFDHYQLYTEYNWPCAQDCFVDWCLDKNFAHTKDGHFFEDAHIAFAEHVHSFISTTS